MTLTTWTAHHLRRIADRIDLAGAPKAISYSFTFENKQGLVFREGTQQGCPLWYYGDADYERAHSEADTDHAVVDWASGTARFGR
jgi:hypothetical protein